ncbi:MAG: hypothetical protein CMO01_01270 [Thalassobius sp.]|nr:hypothetical protein [Thalassovita sp.]
MHKPILIKGWAFSFLNLSKLATVPIISYIQDYSTFFNIAPMKLLTILTALFALSILPTYAQQSVDILKYNKKERAIIVEFTTSLNAITSINTISTEANKHIESTVNLFELEAGSLLTIQKEDTQNVVRIEDYLQKVKMLKLSLELVDVTFNKKRKIKTVMLRELYDVRG